MDTGIVEQDPDCHGRDNVKNHPLFSQFVHHQHKDDKQNGNAKENQVDAFSVEQGHNEYGYKVIGNGQGGKENLQGNGDFVAKDGKDSDGKGDIGSSRDSPTGGGVGAMVYKGIDEGRDNNSAKGGDDRHDGFLAAAELSVHDLPFDFKAYGKEENDHQYVVDELFHRHFVRELEAAYFNGKSGLQDLFVGLAGPRKIGQKHCYDNAYKKHYALRPGPFDELFLLGLKNVNAFVPGINRNQFHGYFPYR